MDTVVIGIDGGEWSILKPLIESGALPNLADIKEDGFSGDLESITPPVSPPAWTSIQTGMNPGKHGIYDFSSFDKHYRRKSVNSTHRKAIPFWQIMNDQNISTGLFKIPFTYPPNEVDGFLLTGFPTPNSVDDFAFPPAITSRVRSPETLFEDWSLQHEGDYEAFKNNLINVVDTQTDLLIDLLDDYDTNFLMTVYDGCDRIQHFFWRYFDKSHPRYENNPSLEEAIPLYYRRLDSAIGRLLNEIGSEANVFIISDHGFGPLEKDIYIEEWLESKGYLVRENGSKFSELYSTVTQKSIQNTWLMIKRLGLDNKLKQILPEDFILSGRELKEGQRTDIRWDKTNVFFTTLSGQSLLINSEDAFSKGTVSEDEYDKVVEKLRTELINLTDPETGDKVIEEVHHRSELFNGWAIDEAPDIVIESKPKYSLKGGRSSRLVRPSKQHQHERSGDHRSTGIFLTSGPDIAHGDISKISIMDIAPTLLYAFDCPIPEAMDGKVKKELFISDISNKRNIKFTSNYRKEHRDYRKWNEKEASELQERLENMGYLE